MLKVRARVIGGLGALCALVFSASALAESVAQAPETVEQATVAVEEATEPFVPVTFSGVQVFIDPETGRLRPPTADEVQELRKGMQRMFAEKIHYSPQVNKNGTTSVVLGASKMKHSVAHVHANGTVSMDCLPSVDSAVDFVEKAAQAPTAVPQREEQ